jgi:hypothetical protein
MRHSVPPHQANVETIGLGTAPSTLQVLIEEPATGSGQPLNWQAVPAPARTMAKPRPPGRERERFDSAEGEEG